MMTLLELTQEFCRRQGLPQPATVISSQDDTVQQILGLLNEGIMDIWDRYNWQQARQRITFNHQNLPQYGALDLAATYPDFKFLVNRTLWDKTSRIELNGPLTPEQWTTLTTMLTAFARYNYRLYGGILRIFPVPNPVNSILFELEYASAYGVWNPVANAAAETFTEDTSYSKLPNNVMLADLKWRWRQAKGLPYAEDQRISEEANLNEAGRQPAADLVMDDTYPNPFAGPGLFIAAGSWPIP